jgi:hypothetical protein
MHLGVTPRLGCLLLLGYKLRMLVEQVGPEALKLPAVRNNFQYTKK